LEYFQKSQKLNRRQARWSLYLSWFDFALFHQPGCLMGCPCIFTSYKQDDWDELLPAAEFAYNNHVHSSMQQVPFMTDTGWLPQIGFEPNGMRSADKLVNEFRDQITAGVSEAKATLIKAKDEFKLTTIIDVCPCRRSR
jgi:hypothetical protein